MENMEKTKSSLKRRLLITLFSALICVLVIGVSVYAALSQNVTLNNNITITTAGQTKVEVVVSQGSNTSTDAVSTAPASQPSWSQVVTKDADNNTETVSNLKAMNFSVSDGINYYAYKLEFTNEGSTEAYAHITGPAIDNAQLTIYTGQEWDSLAAVGNNTAIDADVTLTASNGTGTFYIVVASNVSLDQLNDMAKTPFNINVLIDQTA